MIFPGTHDEGCLGLRRSFIWRNCRVLRTGPRGQATSGCVPASVEIYFEQKLRDTYLIAIAEQGVVLPASASVAASHRQSIEAKRKAAAAAAAASKSSEE